MITKRLPSVTLTALCLLKLLNAHIHAAPPAYTVTVLDYFGTASVSGFCLNNSGQ